ncbi:MAG TPA: peptidoglycan DD-metalloendopeptidase family protein [Rhodanobacteraceae bacterium]|nr:peptidoglycan DD-metalloendopeptidase family protein [Rhodanobacteraceae bacterium]
MSASFSLARTCLLVLLGSAAICPGVNAAPPASASSASAREVATKAKLGAVRAEIAKIADAQHATATKRDAINAKLAAQATQLNQAANAVRESDTAIAAKAASLADLEQQRAALEQKLSGQRAALADLLRAVYTLNRGTDLAMLLGDDDIAKIDRALASSRYFQHDRVARIRALLGEVAQLDNLKASIQAETTALKQQRDQRAAQATELEQARDAQQKLLAQADAQLAQQKDKLAALQHDAAALNQLLKQLQNVFSDIPAQLGKNTPFAELHGKLPWPVAGTPRNGSGVLALGVVIAAKAGAEVRAVAYGRVAWADFMRGYGMLVIIDHGGGWMSLYGGNESAAVSAGDWVRPGQPIATVARNSEQGGAWFGLRRDGKPVDPHGWFASRH